MKDILTIVASMTFAVTVAVMIASGFGAFTQTNPAELGSTDFNRFEKATAVTSVSASSTASTVLLASNPARRYAILSNSGTTPVCIALATSTNTVKPATNCTGIYLAANGGTYIIDADNMYVGPISGIASGTASTIAVVEVE
jgi:hypothetical protein